MARYSHILFDLDGTLIDSAPAILASFQAAFAASGVTPVRPISNDIIGPPLTETLQLLAGSTDATLIAHLSEAFKASYDSSGYRATTAYAGVSELLHELAGAGYSLSIATNKRLHPTRLILDFLGWQRCFAHVYALDLFTPRLPDKASMLQRLISDQGIPPATAVYIGDRAEDGLAATANQLPFIAATWGYGSLSPAELAPGWKLASTPQALAALLRSG